MRCGRRRHCFTDAQGVPHNGAILANFGQMYKIQPHLFALWCNALRGQPNASLWLLKFPAAASTFTCALGVAISPEATPHLTMLLRRSLVDAGLSTYAAKDKYQVPRPFVKLAQPSCSPAEEAALTRDGSYPSGHAAAGWAWGLILTELAPERSQALLERATAFGQSRAVCAVHWKSDIDAGQLMGAAAVAKLHGNADFLAQLGAARAEIASARAKGAPPNRDCTAEANALALDRPQY